MHWRPTLATVEFIFESSIKTIFKISVICCFIGIDLCAYSKKAFYRPFQTFRIIRNENLKSIFTFYL
jgi:hypothetical protein